MRNFNFKIKSTREYNIKKKPPVIPTDCSDYSLDFADRPAPRRIPPAHFSNKTYMHTYIHIHT
jgi:hypothetical protein